MIPPLTPVCGGEVNGHFPGHLNVLFWATLVGTPMVILVVNVISRAIVLVISMPFLGPLGGNFDGHFSGHCDVYFGGYLDTLLGANLMVIFLATRVSFWGSP